MPNAFVGNPRVLNVQGRQYAERVLVERVEAEPESDQEKNGDEDELAAAHALRPFTGVHLTQFS